MEWRKVIMNNNIDSNKILKEYYDFIYKTVVSFKISDDLLAKRCITIDDIVQEVLIKLWKLLENIYEEQYDLKTFIGFQAYLNTKWIVYNLYKSSSGFTTCEVKTTYSSQIKIDDNKMKFNENVLLHHPLFIDNDSFEEYGLSIDYKNLIKKIESTLLKKFNTDVYYKTFYYLIHEPDIFSQDTIYNVLKEKLNYKSITTIKNILSEVLSVIEKAIYEYENS